MFNTVHEEKVDKMAYINIKISVLKEVISLNKLGCI